MTYTEAMQLLHDYDLAHSRYISAYGTAGSSLRAALAAHDQWQASRERLLSVLRTADPERQSLPVIDSYGVPA